MYDVINGKQFVALSKQFADAAFKAQGLAIAGFERAIDLSFRNLEKRVDATTGFFTQATEVRDLEGARRLFPKSFELSREAAEDLYAASQELVGLSIRTQEAIGELVKNTLEQANDGFAKTATAATQNAANAARQATDAVVNAGKKASAQ